MEVLVFYSPVHTGSMFHPWCASEFGRDKLSVKMYSVQSNEICCWCRLPITKPKNWTEDTELLLRGLA